ncbi:hypothetical protein BD410DRAFT_795831 [Rickenella mellea]|uniref:Uncharacterized protein n=1 Tax=Rickenella mellea TaxID=50990 RepID=A0A4Y7PKW0_9AGAM|nr:hypothetical protein BD410DRAFT_795831 [Rickenella mellea]
MPSDSRVFGNTAHTFFLLACVFGIFAMILYTSPLRGMQTMVFVSMSGILAWMSLWCTMLGVVVLSWASQTMPVAGVVSISFGLVFAILVVRWTCAYIPRGNVFLVSSPDFQIHTEVHDWVIGEALLARIPMADEDDCLKCMF